MIYSSNRLSNDSLSIREIAKRVKEKIELRNSRDVSNFLFTYEKVTQWVLQPHEDESFVWQENIPINQVQIDMDLTAESSISNCGEQYMDEGNLEESDEDTEDLPLTLKCRSGVVESWSYRWLLSRIRRDITVSSPPSDRMQLISRTIISGLSKNNDAWRFSLKEHPATCTVQFIINWRPLGFLLSQEYDVSPDEAIGKVITLTGTADDAQAMSAQEYVELIWPLTGAGVLEVIKRYLRGVAAGNLEPQRRMYSYSRESYFLTNFFQSISIIMSLRK